MAKMRPQKGKPQTPKAPTKPVAGKSGRRVSKTNDPKCTQAMSLLQKAIKSGQRPTAEVNATLAMCRNRQRRKLDAPNRKERLKKIQELRRSGERGKALEMARADRKGQTARNEAATLLRQMRQNRGSRQYAEKTQSTTPVNRLDRYANRRERGNELLARLAEVTPRTTLQRVRRHARGDRSYEQRRRERRQNAANAATQAPVKPLEFNSIEARTRRTSNAIARAGGDMSSGGERMQKARTLNTLRRTRAGREIIAEARRTTGPVTYDRIQNTITAHEGRALNRLRTLSTAKAAGVIGRVQRTEYPTQASRNQARQLTARHLLTVRAARQNVAQIASTVGGVTVPAYRGSATHQGVQFIRAATSGGTTREGNQGRRRAPQSARDTYEAVRQQGLTARRNANNQAAPATPPPAPAPAPATPTATRTRTRGRNVAAQSRLTPSNNPRSSTHVSNAQLAEARTQYGQVDTRYSTNSPIPLNRQMTLVSDAEGMGLTLIGTTPQEKFSHLASILGAPPEAARYIQITSSGTGRDAKISLNLNHSNGGGLSRTIRKFDSDGVLEVYNEYYRPGAGARAAGMATDHYNREILAARAAGIPRIAVSGAGRGPAVLGRPISANDWTGYETWVVEYGFDGPISPYNTIARNAVRSAHPDLANVNTYQEAFQHSNPDAAAAARRAWIENGVGTDHVELDIADTNSLSMQGYRRVYERRRRESWNQSNLRTQASRAGTYDIYS